MKFLRVFNALVLLLAVTWTLGLQAQWQFPSPFELPFGLWILVLLVWSVRILSGRKEWRPKTALVPVSLILTIVCGVTFLPMRVLFWTHQSALQRATNRAEFYRQVPSNAQPIGILRPIDIAKTGGATRFLFWEGSSFVADNPGGFAHCPGDAGCSRASFSGYFAEINDDKPDTIQLSRDWVAIRVSGSDF